MAKRKVVVTGLGTFTSLGEDPESFFDNLLEGKCGIGPMTLFDPKAYKPVPQIASEVSGFDIKKHWTPSEDKGRFDPDNYDRYVHFAVAASLASMKDGGLDPADISDPYRFGCYVASGAGGIGTLEVQNKNLVDEGEDAA